MPEADRKYLTGNFVQAEALCSLVLKNPGAFAPGCCLIYSLATMIL
jgi:hypothetical protein